LAQSGATRHGRLGVLARAGMGLCALAPGLLPTSAARAEATGNAELSWVRAGGAESCPAPSAVRAAVAARLGRDPFTRDAAVSFEVVVERRTSGWAARIVAQGTDQGAGSRELASDAPSCDSLAEAVALAIALAIDPDAVERTAQSQTAALALPAPEPATTVANSTAPAAPVTADSEESAAHGSTRISGGLDARGLVSVGLLPGAALGVGLAGEARFARRLAAVAGIDFWPERETAGAGGHFAFGLAAASLGMCADLLRLRLVGLGLCAGGMLGSVHAVVLDLPPTGPGDRLWAAIRAGARLFVPGTSLVRASFGLEAIVPFTRHRFTVRDAPSDVFRQAPVALHASLGVGLGF
jgi:hypothetical protein